MSRSLILTILIAGLIVVGTSTPAWAAQLDAKINPNSDKSPFEMKYQKTVFIEYPNGGNLFDELRGHEWSLVGSADSSDPGVQDLINTLNKKITDSGSQAKISDLNVEYNFHLKARNINTSVDYQVIIDGTLTDYIIADDGQKVLIDLGWRAMSTDEEIVIDGIEINIPINLLRAQEPEAYTYFVGTEVEDVLNIPLINADFILEQPLTNWHFLFDPTGINADASTFGLSSEIAGFVVSTWTMGESSIREGRQVERVFEAEVMADQLYVVRSIQSSDQANLATIGFAALGNLDDIEIAGVTPTPPEGYATTSTGEFPVMIVYGMAGMAAIGGIGFFIFSSRALKKSRAGPQGQTGIDPEHLVGYQTSASSGGYQTNRGEAQLRDDSGYQKTRSMYEDSQTSTEPQQQTPPPQTTSEEAACGCAASAEIGTECDCEMHGSCLCDATCKCNASICKDQVQSMS